MTTNQTMINLRQLSKYLTLPECRFTNHKHLHWKFTTPDIGFLTYFDPLRHKFDAHVLPL